MDREQDYQLRRALRTWHPGQPPARLDRRVMRSFREIAGESRERRASTRLWFRFGIPAAGMAALVIAGVWIAPHGASRREPLRMNSVLTEARQGPAYETQVDASGFRPVENAKIVVIAKGDKQ